MCYDMVSPGVKLWSSGISNLVKGKHLTGHCPAIIEGNPHPPVNLYRER